MRSVIPTRYFLGRPDIGEELHVSIEKGKTLIIRLMAVGPVVEGRAQRDVWFEVNGEASFFTGLFYHIALLLVPRSVPCLLKIRTLRWKHSRGRRPPLILDPSAHQCLALSWK